MEKVTGPNRAVLQPVQHWPYYPAGPLGAALRTGRRIGQRSGRRWPSGFCAGISPSRLWSVGIKDTAIGAIAMTVSYQRP
jgi:hypothetical protein